MVNGRLDDSSLMIRRALASIVFAFSLTLAGCVSDPAWRRDAPDRPRPYHATVSGPSVHPQDRMADKAGSASAVDADSLPTLGESSTLDDYLQYAALNNPGLEAAFNRWRAALERIPQVTTLPDPRFTYGYFIREVETRVGPQEQAFALMQTFPWFGKLRLRGEKAFEQSETLREQYEAARLRLFYEVQNTYFEYYYLGRAIAVVQANRDLVKYLEEVARTRYKAAAAKHTDVIRAQVELGKLEDRLRSLRDLQEPIRARLNAALNRPVGAALPWPKSAPVDKVSTNAEDLLAWLKTANPRLRELAHEVARQERTISLARKDYWPDVTLGLKYIDTDKARMAGTHDSGKDPILASVSINLPIWVGKRRAAVREAKRMRRAAQMRRVDVENTLSSEVKLAYYQFRDAERKINLYRDTLLPKADESLKATETAYRAGNATFSDLVDAERVSLEFTLAYERALAHYNQRLANLEILVGRGIPRTAASDQTKGAKTGDENTEGEK